MVIDAEIVYLAVNVCIITLSSSRIRTDTKEFIISQKGLVGICVTFQKPFPAALNV